MDHFWQNNCDMIVNKDPVKIRQKQFCIHTAAIYTTVHGIHVYKTASRCLILFHNSRHKYFDKSGPLLQIRSHLVK